MISIGRQVNNRQVMKDYRTNESKNCSTYFQAAVFATADYFEDITN